MVITPGVLLGGAGVAFGFTPTGFAQTAAMSAGAGALGIAAGVQADARLFLRSIPPQVAMSPGEKFDMGVLRMLDAMKAVSSMDLVPILFPDSIEQASVWTEPLNAAEAAHLATGIKNLPGLDKLDSGALHAFVVLKTSKGHILLTERLHNGETVLGDAYQPLLHHYASGQVLPDIKGGSPIALRLINAKDSGAQLYAVKEITDGPWAAALPRFAAAQSSSGYDLLTANCQHYADSVLEFASGKGLTYLPNADLMALSSMLMPPMPTVPYVAPGLLSTIAYEAVQTPLASALNLGVVFFPRI